MLKLTARNRLYLSVILISSYLMIIAYYFFSFTERTLVDYLMFIATFLLLLIGMRKGGLFCLGISLFIIFILGSYFIWMEITTQDAIVGQNSRESFSILSMIIWQIALIFVSLVSGTFFRAHHHIISTYEEWAGKYDELVTIDPESGFHNQKRFYFHLLEEFKRAERYGQSFTLLLVKIKNWNEFESLYGQKEADFIIKQVSKGFQEVTRISDSKFRLTKDIFAFILPETGEMGVEKVTEKMNHQLTDQMLLKKERMVTLQFKFGLVSYKKDFENYLEMYQHAMEELDRYII